MSSSVPEVVHLIATSLVNEWLDGRVVEPGGASVLEHTSTLLVTSSEENLKDHFDLLGSSNDDNSIMKDIENDDGEDPEEAAFTRRMSGFSEQLRSSANKLISVVGSQRGASFMALIQPTAEEVAPTSMPISPTVAPITIDANETQQAEASEQQNVEVKPSSATMVIESSAEIEKKRDAPPRVMSVADLRERIRDAPSTSTESSKHSARQRLRQHLLPVLLQLQQAALADFATNTLPQFAQYCADFYSIQATYRGELVQALLSNTENSTSLSHSAETSSHLGSFSLREVIGRVQVLTALDSAQLLHQQRLQRPSVQQRTSEVLQAASGALRRQETAEAELEDKLHVWGESLYSQLQRTLASLSVEICKQDEEEQGAMPMLGPLLDLLRGSSHISAAPPRVAPRGAEQRGAREEVSRRLARTVERVQQRMQQRCGSLFALQAHFTDAQSLRHRARAFVAAQVAAGLKELHRLERRLEFDSDDGEDDDQEMEEAKDREKAHSPSRRPSSPFLAQPFAMPQTQPAADKHKPGSRPRPRSGSPKRQFVAKNRQAVCSTLGALGLRPESAEVRGKRTQLLRGLAQSAQTQSAQSLRPSSAPQSAQSPSAAGEARVPFYEVRRVLRKGLSYEALQQALRDSAQLATPAAESSPAQQSSPWKQALSHTVTADPDAQKKGSPTQTFTPAQVLLCSGPRSCGRALSAETIAQYDFSVRKLTQTLRLTRDVREICAYNTVHFTTHRAPLQPQQDEEARQRRDEQLSRQREQARERKRQILRRSHTRSPGRSRSPDRVRASRTRSESADSGVLSAFALQPESSGSKHEHAAGHNSAAVAGVSEGGVDAGHNDRDHRNRSNDHNDGDNTANMVDSKNKDGGRVQFTVPPMPVQEKTPRAAPRPSASSLAAQRRLVRAAEVVRDVRSYKVLCRLQHSLSPASRSRHESETPQSRPARRSKPRASSKGPSATDSSEELESFLLGDLGAKRRLPPIDTQTAEQPPQPSEHVEPASPPKREQEILHHFAPLGTTTEDVQDTPTEEVQERSASEQLVQQSQAAEVEESRRGGVVATHSRPLRRQFQPFHLRRLVTRVCGSLLNDERGDADGEMREWEVTKDVVRALGESSLSSAAHRLHLLAASSSDGLAGQESNDEEVSTEWRRMWRASVTAVCDEGVRRLDGLLFAQNSTLLRLLSETLLCEHSIAHLCVATAHPVAAVQPIEEQSVESLWQRCRRDMRVMLQEPSLDHYLDTPASPAAVPTAPRLTRAAQTPLSRLAQRVHYLVGPRGTERGRARTLQHLLDVFEVVLGAALLPGLLYLQLQFDEDAEVLETAQQLHCIEEVLCRGVWEARSSLSAAAVHAERMTCDLAQRLQRATQRHLTIARQETISLND